jgi:hypothetical protein
VLADLRQRLRQQPWLVFAWGMLLGTVLTGAVYFAVAIALLAWR